MPRKTTSHPDFIGSLSGNTEIKIKPKRTRRGKHLPNSSAGPHPRTTQNLALNSIRKTLGGSKSKGYTCEKGTENREKLAKATIKVPTPRLAFAENHRATIKRVPSTAGAFLHPTGTRRGRIRAGGRHFCAACCGGRGGLLASSASLCETKLHFFAWRDSPAKGRRKTAPGGGGEMRGRGICLMVPGVAALREECEGTRLPGDRGLGRA